MVPKSMQQKDQSEVIPKIFQRGERIDRMKFKNVSDAAEGSIGMNRVNFFDKYWKNLANFANTS